MEIKKSGIITLCGRPNVGKSTLTNALVGEKVAIVTDKPQTTRNRITAILDRGECQFVFLDTPGLHKPRTRLGDYMVKVVEQSVADVDAVCLLVEPVASIGPQEEELIRRVAGQKLPAVLVINKIDTVKKETLLAVMDLYQKAHPFHAVVPVSAREGEGLDELLDVLEGLLPPGPALFPAGMITDQPERQIMAEIVREKLLLDLDREIPHGTAVTIERFREREDGVVEIEAVIYCEKESHKGIIIGKQGAMLKKISSQAREDMERFLGAKVYLGTWVKVKERWRDRLAMIRNFGYTADE